MLSLWTLHDQPGISGGLPTILLLVAAGLVIATPFTDLPVLVISLLVLLVVGNLVERRRAVPPQAPA